MSAGAMIAVVSAVLGLVVVLVLGYYIIRFMRGSIKITLLKSAFKEGEPITGSFRLMTRKELDGSRLYAALVGKEVTRERRGDTTRTYTREVYRDEQTVEESKTFPAGQTTRYDFQLATPSSAGPGFLDSPLGQTLRVGMELLGGRRRYLRWTVEVRLDARGVDLASRKKITVNMSRTI